ncbi:hypothetical protein ABZU76_18435 [Amycolatopsis sp. NPDC005232]|uniref:hypothetical protein n=1 Tax=Amycolatopsis sp. NPDC005232 TaxID=3157027 RepID=UPI0033BC1FE7
MAISPRPLALGGGSAFAGGTQHGQGDSSSPAAGHVLDGGVRADDVAFKVVWS